MGCLQPDPDNSHRPVQLCLTAQQGREGCGALMFLELLFWKNARDSEYVRDEYLWRVRQKRLMLPHDSSFS